MTIRGLGPAIACAMAQTLGFPMFLATTPLFLSPVSHSLGWGAAVYPQSVLVAAATAALVGPFIGHLMDRFGARSVMIAGLLGWSLAIFSFSLLNGSETQLLALSVLIGSASAASGPIGTAKVIAGWYDRHLGLAMALTMSAVPAIGAALAVAIFSWLIPSAGWRDAFRIFAAAIWVLAVPLALLFLRERRAPEISANAGAAPALPGVTPATAIRSRDFWLVMLVTCLPCGVVQAIVVHFVGFVGEEGIDPNRAAVALAAFSLAGPVGPLLAGALADRVGHPRALAIFYGAPLLGIVILTAFHAPLPAMVIAGTGMAASFGMLPYLLTRYFGLRHASQLIGLGMGAAAVCMSVGPVVLGLARDRMGSFVSATPVMLALLVVGLLAALMLRRPEFGARPLRRDEASATAAP